MAAPTQHPTMSHNEEDKIDLPSEHVESGYGNEKYESQQEPDPFGDEEFAEVKYRTLQWWQAGLIMIAETVSLGILSLPSAMATLGLAPGIILLVGLGIVATYTAYVMGQFKLRYPQVHNMSDAGEILLGRIGREIFGTAQLIILIFVCGSHLLTWNIMMNTITDHGACTVVFGVCGMILSIILALPRTLQKVSWLSILSFISIVSATLITIITIGVQRPGNGHVDATTSPPFYVAFVSVTNIVFAFAGHVAFFGFISEMEKPRDFPKTVFLLQGVDVGLYVLAGVVIYRYGGENVTSPALGSISPLMSKIAYGIAIPTIVIAGVVNGHVACKYVYVRLFRGTTRMQERNLVSVGTWVALVFAVWIIAWIIAESIPVFNNLLGLIAALFASWFTYGLSGVFWLFMNWGQYFSSPKKIVLTLVNLTIFGIAGCICGVGLYVTGKAIHDSPAGTSWAC